MTTLKEILEATNLKIFQDKQNDGSWVKIKTLEAVAKWLTQKRQDLHKEHPKLSAMVAIDLIIDELLEELK